MYINNLPRYLWRTVGLSIEQDFGFVVRFDDAASSARTAVGHRSSGWQTELAQRRVQGRVRQSGGRARHCRQVERVEIQQVRIGSEQAAIVAETVAETVAEEESRLQFSVQLAVVICGRDLSRYKNITETNWNKKQQLFNVALLPDSSAGPVDCSDSTGRRLEIPAATRCCCRSIWNRLPKRRSKIQPGEGSFFFAFFREREPIGWSRE